MVRIASDWKNLRRITGRHLLSVLICALGANCNLAGQARQPIAVNERDDISSLQKQVATLGEQQRQILDQLNELKRLLPASAPGRPTPQPPATLNIQEGLFEGDIAASVVMIEYSDFECPFCGRYEHETNPKVFDNYIKTGKVRLLYRDLPLPMHSHAMLAARAAHCAGDQGKYWEMHDSLFANQSALSDPALIDRVQTLGLDKTKFSECLSSDKYTDDIKKSITEAQRMGIGGTPTFLIGTVGPDRDVVTIVKRIVGARPYADFQSALDELLSSKNPEQVSAH